MHSSIRPWRISGVADLLFVVTSFVASAINVQPPHYNRKDHANKPALLERFKKSQIDSLHFIAKLRLRPRFI